MASSATQMRERDRDLALGHGLKSKIEEDVCQADSAVAELRIRENGHARGHHFRIEVLEGRFCIHGSVWFFGLVRQRRAARAAGPRAVHDEIPLLRSRSW